MSKAVEYRIPCGNHGYKPAQIKKNCANALGTILIAQNDHLWSTYILLKFQVTKIGVKTVCSETLLNESGGGPGKGRDTLVKGLRDKFDNLAS